MLRTQHKKCNPRAATALIAYGVVLRKRFGARSRLVGNGQRKKLFGSREAREHSGNRRPSPGRVISPRYDPPGSVYGRPHQLLRPLHTGAAISHSDEEKIAMAAEEAGCQEESSRSTQTAHRTAHRRVNARETNQSIWDLSWVRRRTHLSRGADRIPIRARRQTMWSCRRLRIGMVEDGIHCASAACISSTGRSPG